MYFANTGLGGGRTHQPLTEWIKEKIELLKLESQKKPLTGPNAAVAEGDSNRLARKMSHRPCPRSLRAAFGVKVSPQTSSNCAADVLFHTHVLSLMSQHCMFCTQMYVV